MYTFFYVRANYKDDEYTSVKGHPIAGIIIKEEGDQIKISKCVLNPKDQWEYRKARQLLHQRVESSDPKYVIITDRKNLQEFGLSDVLQNVRFSKSFCKYELDRSLTYSDEVFCKTLKTIANKSNEEV